MADSSCISAWNQQPGSVQSKPSHVLRADTYMVYALLDYFFSSNMIGWTCQQSSYIRSKEVYRHSIAVMMYVYMLNKTRVYHQLASLSFTHVPMGLPRNWDTQNPLKSIIVEFDVCSQMFRLKKWPKVAGILYTLGWSNKACWTIPHVVRWFEKFHRKGCPRVTQEFSTHQSLIIH